MEKEQLFLVAVPGGAVKKIAIEIREMVNKRFNIYGQFKPALHTTVEVIKPNKKRDLEEAEDLIEKICKQFSPFSLELSGFTFFPSPFKAITLGINKRNEIEILSSLINEALGEKGIIGREDLQSWKFHMTIASPFGAIREWDEEEYLSACQMVRDLRLEGECTIDRLELWRPVFDPNKMVEKVFYFKNN